MTDQRTAFQQGEEAGLLYRLARPRHTLRGAAGFHAGSQNGVSLDFSDYREYHPGDDIRSLDWNVYARTDKLTVKLYHEEVSPHADILLDASRSMALGDAKPHALLGLGALFASAAAGSDCTWKAFELGDRLAAVDRGHDIPSVWGDLRFTAQNNPGAQLAHETARFKRQSIRILISDLLWDAEPLSVLRRLSENASGTAIVQILSRDDASPPELGKYRLNDAETGESLEVFIDSDIRKHYLDQLETHTRLWSDACRQTGAAFCQLIAEDVLDGWALEPLLRTGILEQQGGGPC